jgi:1,4-alpha-glucan branching enzyme
MVTPSTRPGLGAVPFTGGVTFRVWARSRTRWRWPARSTTTAGRPTRWFNNTRGLRGRHTNVFHRNDADKVLAYHRWQDGGPGDDVVVVANFGNRGYPSYTLGLPRPGRWRVRFNSDWDGYNREFGNFFSYDTEAASGGMDSLPCRANVGVGPYTAIILSQ